MNKKNSEISLPLPTTNYRRTLRDLVNFYDNISKKETPPPKLLSYRRLPSVTCTDAYSEKDTASDTEVTKVNKKAPLATRSCRSSPTAPHRYANTYIDTITLTINPPLPFSDTDTDSEMTGKKGSNKGSPMSDNRSDDDRRKGLRQGTLTKSKTSTLSLLVGAMPVPIGGTGTIKKTTLEKVSNQPIGDGPPAPLPLAGTPTNEEGSLSLPAADSTPKGAGLQDDSIDFGTSPSQQPEHLLLQSQIIPHQAVGNTDPNFQATFDDPEHLCKVPASWEELEQREAERLRTASISSNSSSTQQMQIAGAAAAANGTPKRKNMKKHKKHSTRASNGEDDSSSTPVEDMEEDEKTQTVVRKVVLAPTSKRFAEMEAQIQQLHGTINNLTQRLEQQLQTGQQERDSIQKAVSSLAADCRNSHIRLEAHEAGIANLQQHTGVMQTRVEDAEKGINQNTRRIMDAEGSIDTLQENYTSLQQNMDSITREFQQVKTKTSGAANTSEDTCETGVFISGIQEIMKSYNMDPRSDPVAVAGRLLKEIECFHAINRIYIADRAAVNRGRRHEARAVIVYLNSTFYKRQTTILLKKLFEKYKLKGTISDVFPAEESSRALALSRYAAEKRLDKSMTRTRVINRGGTAYLQHTTPQDRFYKDVNISEDSLRPYFGSRQTGDGDRHSGDRHDRADRGTRDGRNRIATRRETRDRHGESNSDRETRDMERATARNNNSSSNAKSNNDAHRISRNQRVAHSPPARLSTSNAHPLGNPRHPVVPQPGLSQPQQQQQNSTTAQASATNNFISQHPLSLQQQQQGAALHLQQHPLQSRGPQQGSLYNDNNQQQQWFQGTDNSAVNNLQVYNAQGGYVHPVPPQMMAFLQQQWNGPQQTQQQLYTTDNNGQQILIQQQPNNTNPRHGY